MAPSKPHNPVWWLQWACYGCALLFGPLVRPRDGAPVIRPCAAMRGGVGVWRRPNSGSCRTLTHTLQSERTILSMSSAISVVLYPRAMARALLPSTPMPFPSGWIEKPNGSRQRRREHREELGVNLWICLSRSLSSKWRWNPESYENREMKWESFWAKKRNKKKIVNLTFANDFACGRMVPVNFFENNVQK